jgi:septal ring factor EnvC (AmiA/AmiB activator)
MSFMPEDDDQVAYVSKATFTHLWEKFKQTEQALAQSDTINHSLASNVLRLGNECKEWADQAKALKEELARVQEDLHITNDALASLRLDHKWLISCHKTSRSAYADAILAIVRSVAVIADLNDKSQPSEHIKAWSDYEAAVGKATDLFTND